MVLDVRSPEYRENPYPFYQKLRREAPVCRVEPMGFWAVARYDDVLTVLRDRKRFSSEDTMAQAAGIRGAEFLVGQVSMVNSDPPEHERLRGLVNKAFTPAILNNLEPRIREISTQLVRRMQNAGFFDLTEDFAIPFPVTVISEMLGIEAERRDDFKRWSDDIVGWRNIPLIRDPKVKKEREDSLARTGHEMVGYLDGIIEERKLHPRKDLISGLCQACYEEQRLSAKEVQSLIRLLLIAGNETTTNLLGNLALALLNQPELRQPNVWPRLRQNRSLIPALVEESLRFDSPVLSLMRRTTEETELAGQTLKKGMLVMPLIASANHDENHFENPEHFDLDRKSQPHLAFGSGIHFCLGAPLARLEARIAFETFLDHFEGWEPDGAAVRLDSFFLRGLKRLPLKASRVSRSSTP